MITITPASHADVASTASVLGTVFAQDTVMGTLVEGADKESRLAELFRSLMRAGGLRSGRIDLARRESSGEILGAAIWEVPGQRTSLFAQARELPGFVRALGWSGVRNALGTQAALGRHRPTEPHWYLAQIGVSAEARGLGVGSALLDSRLAQIDADGSPAYLESSNERNRALYRRRGFVDIAIIEGIPHASPAAMWRGARPAVKVAAQS